MLEISLYVTQQFDWISMLNLSIYIPESCESLPFSLHFLLPHLPFFLNNTFLYPLFWLYELDIDLLLLYI